MSLALLTAHNREVRSSEKGPNDIALQTFVGEVAVKALGAESDRHSKDDTPRNTEAEGNEVRYLQKKKSW